DNQLGGFKRRHTFLKKLAADGWNPVPLDMGGLVKRTGPQQNIKYKYAIGALLDLGYQAITFGAKDLHLSSDPLLYAIANIQGDNPLVSANIDFFGLASPYRIVEAGGKTIGVTAVLGPGYRDEFSTDGELEITDPAEAGARVVPELTDGAPEVCIIHVQ